MTAETTTGSKIISNMEIKVAIVTSMLSVTSTICHAATVRLDFFAGTMCLAQKRTVGAGS
jgi:hypothetical protein